MKNLPWIILLNLVFVNCVLSQTTNNPTGKIEVEENFMPNLFIRVNAICVEPVLINKYMFTFPEFVPIADKEVRRLVRQIDRFATMGPSVDVLLLMNTEYRRSLYFHITRPYGYRKYKTYLDGNYPSGTSSDKFLVYFNTEFGIGIHIKDELIQKNKKKFKGEGNSADNTYNENTALQKTLVRRIFLARGGAYYYHRSVAEGSIPNIETKGSNMFVPCIYAGTGLIRQLDRTNKINCKSDKLIGKRNLLNLYADLMFGLPIISDFERPDGLKHNVSDYNNSDYKKNYFGYRIGIEYSRRISSGLNIKFVYIRKPGFKKTADNNSTFELTIGACFNRVVEKYATRKKFSS